MTAQPISYLTPENFQKKYVGNPHWLIVGVTGHRDLRPQDKAKIKELVTEKLDDLRKKHLNKKLLLCSALAPGADQWVAQCLAKEDKLVVVKTLPDGELKKYTFEIQSPNDPALPAKEAAFDYFTQANQHNERVQLYYDSQRSFTTEEKWMFLKFMHSCGLCFPLKANPSDPDTLYTYYVFPEFLTSIKPQNVKLWLKGKDKVIYKKQFDFLPYYPLHTFISKFGVKTHYEYFWRSGILIYTNVEELEGFCIEADFEKHTLTLTLDESIASEWYEAIVDSIIVHGDQQNTEWQLISGEIRNHESPFEDTMPKLVSDLENLPDVAQKVPPPIHRKKTIVISYAKEDIGAFKMLEIYFKGYSNEFNYWSDQNQDNKSGWKETIKYEFEHADGYILLISPHYMMVDKKIIHEKEIPTILKRQKEKSVPVINLFVGAFTLTSSHDVSVFNSFNKGEVMPAEESKAQDFINRFMREEILRKFI